MSSFWPEHWTPLWGEAEPWRDIDLTIGRPSVGGLTVGAGYVGSVVMGAVAV